MNLSAIIITKNEEQNISRAVKSVFFADEVLVIDAESTDNTKSIAEQAGAKVITNPWPGYGAQKNFGLKQAQGKWLLFIDADEEVSADLAREIQQITHHTGGLANHKSRITNPDFYWLKIVTVFLGRSLNHLSGHNLRLFKKSAGKWTDAKVHEQVEHISAKSREAPAERSGILRLNDRQSDIISEPLLHHSHQTIRSYLEKMHKYTSLDAEQMAKTGQHRSGQPVSKTWLLPWYLSVKQFIKMYFYKLGFLDGYAGLVWCILSSFYEFEMAAKYLQLTTDH